MALLVLHAVAVSLDEDGAGRNAVYKAMVLRIFWVTRETGLGQAPSTCRDLRVAELLHPTVMAASAGGESWRVTKAEREAERYVEQGIDLVAHSMIDSCVRVSLLVDEPERGIWFLRKEIREHCRGETFRDRAKERLPQDSALANSLHGLFASLDPQPVNQGAAA
mgnify:CR=1 FL=1